MASFVTSMVPFKSKMDNENWTPKMQNKHQVNPAKPGLLPPKTMGRSFHIDFPTSLAFKCCYANKQQFAIDYYNLSKKFYALLGDSHQNYTMTQYY
jgi:hypothetical protein